MKCFYHSADLDGHCSGAIVKYKYPDCELFPINYGDRFPWEELVDPKERVYMVDFALQPFEDMPLLKEKCDLIWIDHHITAINSAIESGQEFNGCRIEGVAGCELVWDWCFTSLRPRVVTLLGRYDVWDHSDPMTLPFQYGMRLEETWPDKAMALWIDLFTGGPDTCEVIATAGNTILKYEAQTNFRFCKSYAFETTLPIDHTDEEGYRVRGVYQAICSNRGFTNSQLFDSIYNPDKHHLMITFCRLPLPKKLWTVSLYSNRPDVNCGEIAKKFGGGGHKGAAGFQCFELPFEV